MGVTGWKISAKSFPESENIWDLAFIINCDIISGQAVIVLPSWRDRKTHSKIIRWSFFSRSHWNIRLWRCGLSPKTANKKDKLGLYGWAWRDWMVRITLSKALWASLLNSCGEFKAVSPFNISDRRAKSWFEMPRRGWSQFRVPTSCCTSFSCFGFLFSWSGCGVTVCSVILYPKYF